MWPPGFSRRYRVFQQEPHWTEKTSTHGCQQLKPDACIPEAYKRSGPSRKPDSALSRLMGVRVPDVVGGCPTQAGSLEDPRGGVSV